MDAMRASNQWASRKADERYWSVDEMSKALRERKERCHVGRIDRASDLQVMPDPVDTNRPLQLMGSNGGSARLTSWSFQQLATLAGAPAGYVRDLPADLASLCVNHGLQSRAQDINRKPLRALIESNGVDRVRGITTTDYSRIWDHEVVERVASLQTYGWTNPPAWWNGDAECPKRTATESDCVGDASLVKPGDTIGPAGLYASDRDCFMFLVHPERQVSDGLFRGVIVSNSETGGQSWRLQAFLMSVVCGNHILWNCKELANVRLTHRGRISGRITQALGNGAIAWANRPASEDQARISKAIECRISDPMVSAQQAREQTIERVYGQRIASRKATTSAYDLAVEHPRDGHKGPDTVWGMVQGFTRLSQEQGNSNERTAIDSAASKLLECSF